MKQFLKNIKDWLVDLVDFDVPYEHSESYRVWYDNEPSYTSTITTTTYKSYHKFRDPARRHKSLTGKWRKLEISE